MLSSDLGAGPYTNVPGCTKRGGDRGVFQALPRGDGGRCTAAPTGQNFISAVDMKNNFQGSISDALSCIADLGTKGCGFEHQIASVAAGAGRRPGRDPVRERRLPARRRAAGHRAHHRRGRLLRPRRHRSLRSLAGSVTDPLGPLESYRCNEFGHLCGGVPPPRFTAATDLADCHSNEVNGKLIKIADFVSFFKSLKSNSDDVHRGGHHRASHALLGGAAAGDGLEHRHQNEPRIVPSCQSSNGLAAPSVRIKDFIDAFGANGTLESICEGDFSPAMARIGNLIAGRIRHQCVEGKLVDGDPAQPGVQPNCEVFEETQTAAGLIRTSIDSCDGAGPPCWSIQPDTTCATRQEVVVDRGDVAAPPHTRIDGPVRDLHRPGRSPVPGPMTRTKARTKEEKMNQQMNANHERRRR